VLWAAALDSAAVRRNWFIAAIVLGIVSIAGAALIMRLTEDDSGQPSATTWADSVCTSFSTWRSSITAISDVSGDTLTRESLKQSLADATSATETLVGDLQDLGPPDLDSGDDLKQQLDSAAAEVESSFETLKQGAEDAADAASPQDFLQALAVLAPQFQALLDTISTTVDDLENANVAEDAKAELQEAFENASSCQQLQADS
jgi:hypothetical protein